jgi:tetratricopeptide (TPR) repeat protein
MRRAGFALVLCALALASGGCTAFRTTDIYRPLILASFPGTERVRALHADYFPDVESDDFERSVDLTRAAWTVWGFQKYQSFFADLDIERLVDAITASPRNPFAWTQLGGYLALQHRPAAGAEATRRALDLLDELGDLSGAEELVELKQISAINLAIYHNTAGQPRAALDALTRLGAAEGLMPFHRLAFYWAKAQAHTALGEVESSREALVAASASAELGLGSMLGAADYPQYFKPHKRKALFHYLEAANLRAEGHYDEAISELERALDGKQGDRRLWDARFLRALAYREIGNLDRARNELEALGADVPGSLFRREAIYYHLALVLIEQDELEDAENVLAKAVELVEHDDRVLRKGLKRVAGEDVPEPVARVLATAYAQDGWIFPPAFEALGQAYLDRLDRVPKWGDPISEEAAERMFEIALGERGFPDDRHLRPSGGENPFVHYAAHGTLELGDAEAFVGHIEIGSPGTQPRLPGASTYARRHLTLERVAQMHWEDEEYDIALGRFSEALWTADDDPGNLASLVERGSRVSDPAVARRAYDLVLEHLPLAVAPYGVEIGAGRQLERSLAEEPAAAGSEELAHLEARLLLLRGDLAAAEAAFRAAGRAYPAALWPHTGRVWVELNRDRPGDVEAARGLDRALEAGGTLVPLWQRRDAHFVRGELRLLAGDEEGARADLAAAATLEPGWELARRWAELADEEAVEAAAEPDAR